MKTQNKQNHFNPDRSQKVEIAFNSLLTRAQSCLSPASNIVIVVPEIAFRPGPCAALNEEEHPVKPTNRRCSIRVFSPRATLILYMINDPISGRVGSFLARGKLIRTVGRYWSFGTQSEQSWVFNGRQVRNMARIGRGIQSIVNRQSS